MVKLSLLNDHIMIDDSQRIIIDTGSPLSFHMSGIISLEKNIYNVPTTLPSCSAEYLTENIRGEIHGLLGMDLLTTFPCVISLKDGFMLLDDNDYPIKLDGLKKTGVFGIGNLPPYITVMINDHQAQMILDTGAKISYIKQDFINDSMESDGIVEDYNPLLGTFSTKLYHCSVEIRTSGSSSYHIDSSYTQLFGTPIDELSVFFNMLGVDGILGVDFFKQYRLQIKKDGVYLPPQGI